MPNNILASIRYVLANTNQHGDTA